MKTTCTRKLSFCAGHRVLGHGGKCASWHGHEYTVFLTAAADVLDDLGMVVDFSVLKDRVGVWLESEWDHGFLISSQDAEMISVSRNLGPVHKTVIVDFNPTAENMAEFILNKANSLMPKGVQVVKVDLWETSNCFASATHDYQA